VVPKVTTHDFTELVLAESGHHRELGLGFFRAALRVGLAVLAVGI
jgi:hypothetical protein